MPYTIIIENAGSNYSAYAPSLLGCIATGKTIDEVKKSMEEAIEFHLEGMALEGLAIPSPDLNARYIVEELQPAS